MKNFLPSRSVTLYRLEALQKENSSLFIDLLGCRDNNWSNDESNEKIVKMYGKKLNFDDLWVCSWENWSRNELRVEKFSIFMLKMHSDGTRNLPSKLF